MDTTTTALKKAKITAGGPFYTSPNFIALLASALLAAGAYVTIGERRPLLHYLADFALIGLARSAGNYLTFNALYW